MVNFPMTSTIRWRRESEATTPPNCGTAPTVDPLGADSLTVDFVEDDGESAFADSVFHDDMVLVVGFAVVVFFVVVAPLMVESAVVTTVEIADLETFDVAVASA